MFNPIFHGPLLILSFFLMSTFYFLGGKVLESMPVRAPYYSEHVQTAVMRGSIHRLFSVPTQ